MRDIRNDFRLGGKFEERVKIATKGELDAALQSLIDDLDWCKTMYKIKSTSKFKIIAEDLLEQERLVEKALAKFYSDRKKILENITIVQQYRE
jgi:hypothetical protein